MIGVDEAVDAGAILSTCTFTPLTLQFESNTHVIKPSIIPFPCDFFKPKASEIINRPPIITVGILIIFRKMPRHKIGTRVQDQDMPYDIRVDPLGITWNPFKGASLVKIEPEKNKEEKEEEWNIIEKSEKEKNASSNTSPEKVLSKSAKRRLRKKKRDNKLKEVLRKL